MSQARLGRRLLTLAISIALLVPLPSVTLADGNARVEVKRIRYLAPAAGTTNTRTRLPLPPPLIPLPPVRQHSRAACGTSCLQSVFAYYGKPSRRGSQLVRAAQARRGYTYEAGTTEQTMSRLARAAGLKVKASSRMSLSELVRSVSSGQPVAVGIQAWVTHPDTVDWRKEKEAGHYVVAIGLGDALGNPITRSRGLLKRDDAYLWFMDPAADLGNRGYLPVKEFMTRWHWPADVGDATHRFGMAFSSSKRPGNASFVSGAERIR